MSPLWRQTEPFHACAARMRVQKQNCVCWSHLNIDNGDCGLGLVEVPSHPVHSLGDKVQHQIQINFIFLESEEKKISSEEEICTTKNVFLSISFKGQK